MLRAKFGVIKFIVWKLDHRKSKLLTKICLKTSTFFNSFTIACSFLIKSKTSQIVYSDLPLFYFHYLK